MHKVTNENWGAVAKSAQAIIEFSAPWCGPCKKQAEVISEFEKNHSISVGNIDIEESCEIAERFKVKSVPTIVLLEDGQEKSRLEGFQTMQKLQQMMQVTQIAS